MRGFRAATLAGSLATPLPEQGTPGPDTVETLARLQADGTIFTGAAKWRGQWVLRLSVIAAPFDEPAGDRATAAIRRAWQAVPQNSSSQAARLHGPAAGGHAIVCRQFK